MKNWGNWSYDGLINVINGAKAKGQKVISIDQEHTDWQNDQQVESWLQGLGLRYETRAESTTIYLEKEKYYVNIE